MMIVYRVHVAKKINKTNIRKHQDSFIHGKAWGSSITAVPGSVLVLDDPA